MRRFLIETVGKVGETMAVLKGLVNEEDGENGFSWKRMSFLIESKDYMKKNNTPANQYSSVFIAVKMWEWVFGWQTRLTWQSDIW